VPDTFFYPRSRPELLYSHFSSPLSFFLKIKPIYFVGQKNQFMLGIDDIHQSVIEQTAYILMRIFINHKKSNLQGFGAKMKKTLWKIMHKNGKILTTNC